VRAVRDVGEEAAEDALPGERVRRGRSPDGAVQDGTLEAAGYREAILVQKRAGRVVVRVQRDRGGERRTFARVRTRRTLPQDGEIDREPRSPILGSARRSQERVTARVRGVVVLESLAIEVGAQARRPRISQGEREIDPAAPAPEGAAVRFDVAGG